MKIRSIHIKNLKSITDLEVNFEDGKGICLLYGANGVGKTTLLEAISLLGHISSMSRLAVLGQRRPLDVQESRFREEYRNEYPKKYKQAISRHNAERGKHQTNAWGKLCTQIIRGRKWWESFPLNNNNVAAIKYNIIFDHKELSFWVFFIQESDSSITKALSGDGEHDDLSMDGNFTIAYRKKDDEVLQNMIEHMLFMSPHVVNYKGKPEGLHLISRGTIGRYKGENPAMSSIGLVSYINTDLDNFGRKNDVRESVKDINADFYPVMRERFGLDIGKANHRTRENKKRLKDLNESLEKAIPDGALNKDYSPNSISISRLYSEPGETYIEVARPGLLGRTVDYFSAGENEAFTIYLLLLWMPITNSILLLDEPDLHVSTYYGKESFFRELFKLAEEKGCQLIISTHGGFVLPEEYTPSIQEAMLRRKVENLEASYSASWTPRDQYEIAIYYYNLAKKVLERLLSLLENKPDLGPKDVKFDEAAMNELYAKIGRLEMQIEKLKKHSDPEPASW